MESGNVMDAEQVTSNYMNAVNVTNIFVANVVTVMNVKKRMIK